jgi:ABC-type polysaccharide/polyol phosphate export permease
VTAAAPGLRGWDRNVLWQLTQTGMRRRTSDRVLGVAWWLLDPLLLVGVYALVFGGLLEFGRHAEQNAYPLFVACALIPWRWFAMASTQGASAFQQNHTLLLSTPVHRETVLLSEWISASAQALAGVALLLALMLVYEVPITWNLLWLPLPLAVLGALALGVAYFLCPLGVMLPDVGNLYAALLRLVWFLSPGLYALSRVPRGRNLRRSESFGHSRSVRRPIHAGLPDWERSLVGGVRGRRARLGAHRLPSPRARRDPDALRWTS